MESRFVARFACALACSFAILLLLAVLYADAQPVAVDAPTAPRPAVERYVPDDRPRPAPPRPTPDSPRVLYAESIVLGNSDSACRITLTTVGRQPGIVMEHKRTHERVVLYFGSDGRAVVGVTTPARKELAAGLFASGKAGFIQLADERGVHVLSGAELSGAGAIGAKPK